MNYEPWARFSSTALTAHGKPKTPSYRNELSSKLERKKDSPSSFAPELVGELQGRDCKCLLHSMDLSSILSFSQYTSCITFLSFWSR